MQSNIRKAHTEAMVEYREDSAGKERPLQLHPICRDCPVSGDFRAITSQHRDLCHILRWVAVGCVFGGVVVWLVGAEHE